MGGKSSKTTPPTCDYIMRIKTGDVKRAGTDANVYGCLYNVNGEKSARIKLDDLFRNDFERGQTNMFQITNLKNFGDIKKIEIERDAKGLFDDWYVEIVTVERCSDNRQFVFPVHRWIPEHRPVIVREFDAVLPQMDDNKEQRQVELQWKQDRYQLCRKMEGLPAQINECPSEERFSDDYKRDYEFKKMTLMIKALLHNLTSPKVEKLEDLEKLYNKTFPPSVGLQNWKSDVNFGYQRLTGCNSTTLRRCDNLPKNLAVTEEMLSPFLENQALSDVITKKRLYYIDYAVLDGIVCTDNRKIPAPIALFYVNGNGDLVPIAIQLEQKPAENNPVFQPSDPEYTWLLAKMFFNVADSSFHQAAAHLGFTHLIMESVWVSINRQLSPSHPLFRLMAPHFLYLIAINSSGIVTLTAAEGWVDTCTAMGSTGLFNIMKERFKTWKMTVQGSLPNDLKERGVDDVEALPNYHYRDDALLTYSAIKKYVTTVVEGVYTTPHSIKDDYELQAWVHELSLSEKEGGCNISDIPDELTSCEEIVALVTSAIFISSVGHAAGNFCQYDEYGFQPNYPLFLQENKKPTSKEPATEQDVVDALPEKMMIIKTMAIATILSDRTTNALGNFEVEYAFDPLTSAALKEFRKDCEANTETIEQRNRSREKKYDILSPNLVPNAISI